MGSGAGKWMPRLSSRCTGLFSILTLTSVRCLAAGRRGTTAVIISRPYWCRPGEGQSAVYRRNLDGSEPRYYLSNSPEDTPLETLAYEGGSRWRIETGFETEKSDVGFDEYEMRTWAGWHHHLALCLLAGAFLLSLQRAWREKDAAAHEAAGVPGVLGDAARERFGLAELLGRLEGTQPHNERASRCPREMLRRFRACPNLPP